MTEKQLNTASVDQPCNDFKSYNLRKLDQRLIEDLRL
jgi:hypothetical protein